MTYVIYTGIDKKLNWSAKADERIIQNIYNLLNTYRYEVGYDRTLGLKRDFLDMPLNEAIPIAKNEIYSIINDNVPNAIITSIDYIGMSTDGNLNMKVVIEI
jgi:hypothetical protein